MKEDKKKIAKVTLEILKKKIWEKISLNEIKTKSKVKQFEKLITNKKDVLKIINHYFDYEHSLSAKKLEESNAKDKIFELIMMRFDILQNYRKPILSIYNSFSSKPSELAYLLPNLLESIILIFKYANFPTKSSKAQLKVLGVLIIYMLSFLAWIKDESVGLEKTMQALDNYLEQAGKILSIFK